ncbi:hypothetical protein J4443_05055 [Candidatus Woesearchaeota archaeon]|nr:hypothetical protein [Candidatus Woesearchaeota archaeon]
MAYAVAESRRRESERVRLVLETEEISSIKEHGLERDRLIKLPRGKRGRKKGSYGIAAEHRELLENLARKGTLQTEIARILGTHKQTINQYLLEHPESYERWKEERKRYTLLGSSWEVIESLAYMGCPQVLIGEATGIYKTEIHKYLVDHPELYEKWREENRRFSPIRSSWEVIESLAYMGCPQVLIGEATGVHQKEVYKYIIARPRLHKIWHGNRKKFSWDSSRN